MTRKIMKLFRIIGVILRNPKILNKIIEDDCAWKPGVRKKHKIDAGLPVVSFGHFLRDEKWTISPYAFLYGGSLPTDLSLLGLLARQIPDCSYFEIGTWRGESVAAVAPYAKECTTLNLSAAEMRDIGFPEDHIEVIGYFSSHLKNVNQIHGNTLTFDFSALQRRFDLIFIDGDHHYRYVKNDTQQVFRHLAHDRTIVVWHDYAHNPGFVRWEVLAGILDGLPKDKHKNLYAVTNTLSAIYYPGGLPVESHPNLTLTGDVFKVDLQISK